MGGSLAALAPTAPAQATPATLCLSGDPGLDGEPRQSELEPCTTSRTPDYPQGSEIGVSVPGWTAGQSFLSARCTTGCPSADPSATNVYWVLYRGGVARFPADFIDAGPNNNGGNAILDRAPRYNSSWQFTLHLGAPIQRLANVWTYDAWADDFGNHSVRPGATHKIVSSGFDPNAEVIYRWERRDPNSGRYNPFHTETGRSSASGTFTTFFQFPKNEAQKISSCGGLVFDCYRLAISGAGKEAETVNVQVGLAEITRSDATSKRPAPGERVNLQRTQNVSGTIDLYYPSGNLHTGPKFMPEDPALSPRFGHRALRVAVEKSFTVNATTYLLDEVPLVFDPPRLVWVAQWTIPKDAILDDSARYGLRLVEQRDAYGNRVREDWLVNFTIEPAEILPRIDDPFRELRRTELGIVRLGVRYHNGSPFTPAEAPEGNDSPLRGCFVRVPAPAPAPAPPASAEVPTCSSHPNVEIVYGKYYEGAWNFTVKYPRNYEHLQPHRFILVNGTIDRWGNQIFSIAGPAYDVVVARPDVAFSTVMRGEETQTLERGNRVFVSATITYHDGSPYNHLVRANPNSSGAQVLSGTLVRRGPGVGGAEYGPIASEEPFNLTLTDASAGRWSAHLQLTDDDTFTPVGIWSWKLDIVDNVTTPNRNASVADREVVSSLIRICPTYQPASSAATGSNVKFRFRLYYSECDVGREVPVGAIESKLVVRAYAYNPQNLSTFGAPVSNALIPAYSRDGTLDWGIDYQIPNSLFAGSYAFVVTGADSFGNKVVPNSRSRPFSTFTEIITRGVITQPQPDIERGDGATVVFDAREGDTGVDPSRPAPRIQLERFDTASTSCPTAAEDGGCWVRERADVRVFDPTLEDHMGVHPVGVDTPVGVYRFALQGRDRDFRIITGVSSNFTVSATQVTRALIELPPERIVKGEAFTFRVESLPGDQIRDRRVYFNGRPMFTPAPLLTHERGALNVTWSVPFEAPAGNYTVRLSGIDVNGNTIAILTPPIDALPASLEGRIIGQPPRTVQRGEPVRLQFGVGYPDGSFYAAADEPRVFVVSAAGISMPATIRREGLSFAAFWEPGPEALLGEHYFEVAPQATGTTGNLFPPLRSQTFRVVPGAVERAPVDEIHAEVERLSISQYTVPFDADDRFVGFELVYYGPSLSTQVDTTRPLTEITRTPLPHTIAADQGKYVARLITDHQTQTGTYKIIMTGEDAYGNVIKSESQQFLIRPTTIGVVFDTQPEDSAFGEGKTISLSFVAKYRVGSIMDDSYGQPSVAMLYQGRPVTPRPEITYADGHWFVTWEAPAILPPGQYEIVVGGADVMNNPIGVQRSKTFIINEPSIIESANKVIPGPSPILVALVAIAIAGAFLRRRT